MKIQSEGYNFNSKRQNRILGANTESDTNFFVRKRGKITGVGSQRSNCGNEGVGEQGGSTTNN